MSGKTSGSLFSGAGALDLAVEEVLGSQTAWFSQYEPPTKQTPRPSQAASKVLAAHWPGVPNLGDITAIDWATVPRVDILTGGFPCQDMSLAGNREGMREGTRSGLWSHMLAAVAALRPGLVVIENVRGLTSACADSDLEPCPRCVGGSGPHRPVLRALGRVLGDLADVGYDAAWTGLRAADVGAPHGRFRVFVLAWPAGDAEMQRRDDARPPGRRGDRESRQSAGGSDLAAEDADRAARGEWRLATSGEAEGGRARSDAGGSDRGRAAADADVAGSEGRESAGGRHLPDRRAAPDADRGRCEGGAELNGNSTQDSTDRDTRREHAHGRTAANASRDGRDERRPESAGLVGGSDAAERGTDAPADAERGGRDGRAPVPVGGPGGGVAAAGCGEGDHGRGGTAADAYRDALRVESEPESGGCGATVAGVDRTDSVPDTEGDSRWLNDRDVGPAADTAFERRRTSRGDDGVRAEGLEPSDIAWGQYEPAIRRWERLTRPAPAPTELAPKGGQRLSPAFVEWMQGWPSGWVSQVEGISWNDMLRICGNGVVPQQASEALRQLLDARATALCEVA